MRKIGQPPTTTHLIRNPPIAKERYVPANRMGQFKTTARFVSAVLRSTELLLVGRASPVADASIRQPQFQLCTGWLCSAGGSHRLLPIQLAADVI
jgi:hypothetical protein